MKINCKSKIDYSLNKIGFAREDDGYSGGKKYYVFQEGKGYFDICQHSLETNFELIEGTIL